MQRNVRRSVNSKAESDKSQARKKTAADKCKPCTLPRVPGCTMQAPIALVRERLTLF